MDKIQTDDSSNVGWIFGPYCHKGWTGIHSTWEEQVSLSPDFFLEHHQQIKGFT